MEPPEVGGFGLLPPASAPPLLNDFKKFHLSCENLIVYCCDVLKISKQLSLKRIRELAADLQAGITESEAVAKYRTSKGTLGRVRRDVHMYLDLDVDALGEDRKRELKVRTD